MRNIHATVYTLLLMLGSLVQFNAVAQSSVGKSLPSNSIYHLQASLEDQSGEIAGLDQHQGQPTLVTMFYASCPHVCPLIISTIKLTEAKLSEVERSNLRVLMISVDPETDTPAVLLENMQRHALDAERWSMVRPEPGDLRAIAGVLGIKYKQLPDGEFNHSTKISLLDGNGSPLASSSQIGRLDEGFLQAVKTSLQ